MEQKLDLYTRVLCDLCGKECSENEYIKTLTLQPYRGVAKIDICEQCSQELSEKWKKEREMEEAMQAIIKNIPTKK